MTALPSARGAARTMQLGLDALVAVLSLLVLWRGGPAAPLGPAFAVVYLIGRVVLGPVVRAGAPPAPRPRTALVWVSLLTAVALVAAVGSVDGIWLAFPVFLLQLHVLAALPGVIVVAATTAATVALGAGRAALGPGAVLGPVLGAAVCVGVVLGVRAVILEAEERRVLLEDLVAARHALAERERAAAVGAERQRLAREIHDTLAQGLTSIELVLRAADGALTSGDPARARELVGTARAAARDNLAEARAFVRDLPSPLVGSGGLHGALERLAEQTRRSSGLQVAVAVTGDEQHAPGQVEQVLWRVAQQAVANTVQHAAADRVTLTLSYLGDVVALDVVDDGVGFDPAGRDRDHDRENGRGTGLTGMAERVRALGGSLSIESAPGAGTAVGAAVPL